MGAFSQSDSKKSAQRPPAGRSNDHGQDEPIPYEEALHRLQATAKEHREFLEDHKRHSISFQAQQDAHARTSLGSEKLRTMTKRLPIIDAVGYASTQDIKAPRSTPDGHLSGIDGYVVRSDWTDDATQRNPVILKVFHSIATGADRDTGKDGQSLPVPDSQDDAVCVEIMAGACLPEVSYPHLDAVVKAEDVDTFEEQDQNSGESQQYIKITRPVLPHQNRRPADSDLVADQTIVKADQLVEPKHVAAMASVNINQIDVIFAEEDRPDEGPRAFPRVGVISIGSELYDSRNDDGKSSDSAQRVADSNGPYLTTSLKVARLAPYIHYAGVTGDNEQDIASLIRQSMDDEDLDCIISSGGVSMSKLDLVCEAVETKLDGKAIFHGVAVRPGLPLLLAMIERDVKVRRYGRKRSQTKKVAFFGLPRDPIAAAACLRFFVIPYLTVLRDGQYQRPSLRADLSLKSLWSYARHHSTDGTRMERGALKLRKKPNYLTVFWLGRRHEEEVSDDEGPTRDIVELLPDQATYKLRTLLEANCWIVVPSGTSSVAAEESVNVTMLA